MNDEEREIVVEDQVLSLDDGSEYVLLDEFDFEGKRYFYTVGYDEKNGYDYDDYLFFEHGVDENNEEYVEKVEDEIVFKRLLAFEMGTTFGAEPELNYLLDEEGNE